MRNGFISYAHEDHRLFQEFRKHLRAIERGFGIGFWSDERLDVGYHWGREILSHIETADLFVLLISPAFLASDYICDKELPAIEARHAASDQALILPVVLEPCFWQLIGAHWQAAPTEHGSVKAIASWRPRNQGHDRARAAITESIQTFYGQAPVPLVTR